MNPNKFLLTGLVIAAGVVATACDSAESTPTSAATTTSAPTTVAVPVQVEAVSSANGTTAQALASGSVEALRISPLHFAEPGKVQEVLVQEGDFVRAGQVLARLDADQIRFTLQLAEAQLAQAEDLYRRLEANYKADNLSERDYVDIQTRVKSARIQVDQQRKRLAEMTMTAPHAGVISFRNLEVGMAVSPEVPGFHLAELGSVYVRIPVTERQLTTLKVGQTLPVQISSLGITTSGRLSIINPVADPQTRTYSVKLAVANPNLQLRPGMLAEVALQDAAAATTERVSVPAQALLRDDKDKPYVYVANTQSRIAERRHIQTGRLQGGRVEVLQGLRQGEMLVVAGNQKLNDGQSIQF